jgi:hypothetical protein
MARFCETCDEELDAYDGTNGFAFGEYEELCGCCWDDLRQTSFECDECKQAVLTEYLVEDIAYPTSVRCVCRDCFIETVMDELPAPLCECGKNPCPQKTPAELVVQLEKKTELYEDEDETPTKNPFHKDCCKVCGFAAQLASRTVTYDNQRVGFLMRLKLGNDASALINRFLGGTAVSKLVQPEYRLKQYIRSIRYSDDDDAPSNISYMSAQAAQYEMRARYENKKQPRKIHSKTILQRLFEARLELLDE